MIIDMDLYGKIRYMYVQQKMSQRAIAKELGISRNTVRKYCGGEHVKCPPCQDKNLNFLSEPDISF